MADNTMLVKSFEEAIELSESRWTEVSMGVSTATPVYAPSSAREASLALQIALKCADMGHLALGWGDHTEWVQRLEQEFFAQGDRERALGMPEVSFLMDREKPGVTQTQTVFF